MEMVSDAKIDDLRSEFVRRKVTSSLVFVIEEADVQAGT